MHVHQQHHLTFFSPTSGVPGLNAEQIAMLQQVTATQQPLKNKSIDVESTNEPSALRPSDASSYVPPSTSANAGSTAVTSANNNEENPTNANHKFHPDEKAGDLSQFDMSTFDPSLPASWLRFAQQWYNTYQVSNHIYPTAQRNAHLYIPSTSLPIKSYSGDWVSA